MSGGPSRHQELASTRPAAAGWRRKERNLEVKKHATIGTAIALCGLALSAFAAPSARADGAPYPIRFTYHGGPVIPNVHVVTIFWGSAWRQLGFTENFVNGFFSALFKDGRYMKNLSQYSA